jgi:hypothetical protein
MRLATILAAMLFSNAASAADGPSVIAAGVHECQKLYGHSFERLHVFVLKNGDQWIVRFGSASDDQEGALVAVIDARTGEGQGCSLHARHWGEPGGREVEKYFRHLHRSQAAKPPNVNQ